MSARICGGGKGRGGMCRGRGWLCRVEDSQDDLPTLGERTLLSAPKS